MTVGAAADSSYEGGMEETVEDRVHRVNHEALMTLPTSEYDANKGRIGVFYQGRVVSYHDTNRDALREALSHWSWGEFSVQEIDKAPLTVNVWAAPTTL